MLFLCEKPSQARDIGRVMGVTSRRDGYLEGGGKRVTWCIGHLLEMAKPDAYRPEWKAWHFGNLPMLPDRWKLGVRASVGKQFKIVKRLLKETQEVVIATDSDREGETIGRELLEQCGYRGSVSRLWLSALDDASIRKALNTILPGQKTEPLYRAGLGRARADWLVGMNLTRAYTILGRKGGYDGVLTVGRVQTPTLKLVVDRDRLIENFKPLPFFEVLILFQVQAGQFQAQWIPGKTIANEDGLCLKKKSAEEVLRKVQGQSGIVLEAETKRMKEAPPLPLELSTLQQLTSQRWGMAATKTLKLAQALYETHKAITYPRTDCRFLPTSQFREAPQILKALSESDPSFAVLVREADTRIRSKAWNDKKITAHHAIIPTAAMVDVARMSPDEQHLHDLIRRHYLVQFFPAFEYDRTIVEVEVQKELFRASGNVETVPGWKLVLRIGKEETPGKKNPLPVVKKGEPAQVLQANLEEKQTKPPQRFTEGTLIQAMKSIGQSVEDPRFKKILRETSGIGTEATRASIIENLLKRTLLAKEGKKNLISTAPGRALVDILPKSVTNPATTAIWEQALEDIAMGTRTLEAFQEKAEIWVTRLIGAAKIEANTPTHSFSAWHTHTPKTESQTSSSPTTGTLCPQCGQVMRRRKSGRSWFWGCSAYPSCQATLPDQKGRPSPTSTRCPKCKTGTLVERTAKKGKQTGERFLGCRSYPQCRFTQPIKHP